MSRLGDENQVRMKIAKMIWIWILLGILMLYHFVRRKIMSSWNKKNESLQILYHSNNYLVVSKPYDMVVNSNNIKVKSTLECEIAKIFPNLANPALKHNFHFVHRLDYPTSGVICVALNKNSARAASYAFEKRWVKKYYLALVHGHIQRAFLVIEKSIGEDMREALGSRKMCTNDDFYCKKPRDSVTALLVLEKGLHNGKPATKILLQPRTGRRHQLRVHCFHIGHTIIGDYTYSNRQDLEPHRTFLHSLRLILYNEIEHLDIETSDPFNSIDNLNKWQPIQVIRSLDENAFDTIDRINSII